MGEKLYDISEIHLRDVDFKVELNDGTASSNKKKYIHLQNDRFRLALSDSEYVEMAVAIRAAGQKIKDYDEDIYFSRRGETSGKSGASEAIEVGDFEGAYLEDDVILIDKDNKKSFAKKLKSAGWKQLKDKSGDLYLYGMEHFMYFIKNEKN